MKFLNKFKISLPPLPTPPPAHAPERRTLLLLAALVAVAVFSHFLLGHIVIAAYGALIWLMKTAAITRLGPRPARWLVMLLTILSFVLVLVFYGGWNGQKAGISFLVLLAALKFLESQSLRDYYMVCLILLFLASSSFLFNASLLSIVAVLLFTIGTIAVMLQLSDPQSRGRFAPVTASGIILLKALPLAILLFFFFPRIHGNFGFIPSQDDFTGENKLDDAMVAGDFASSAFSTEPAFRVEFDGATPPNNLLYWRAKVMVDERNFSWEVRRPDERQLRSARALADRSAGENPLISYQIVHEPSDDNFLPYLDYALNPESGIQLPDMSVYRLQKVNGVFAYEGSATLHPNISEAGANGFPTQLASLLNTTSIPSARALALLNRWRQSADSDLELVREVLAYMKDNKFVYSLSPPGLGENPIDEFLFETRTGYCEHFASSFTILMRWLEIPARVVVGYQGGTRNLAGDYLQVRYSDAHAWSEVWLNGVWRRVDPTTMATLGEERINQGMTALLSLWEDGAWQNWDGNRSLADYLQPSGFEQALRRARDSWDNIGYQWNKWVINYDFEAQKALLTQLGFKHRDSAYTLLGILMASSFALILFYFWQLIPKAIKLGEAQQAYLKFLNALQRFKLEKAPSETPLEFAQRASAKVPWHAEQIQSITASYVELRYGRDSANVSDFKQRVKMFKPRKINQ